MRGERRALGFYGWLVLSVCVRVCVSVICMQAHLLECVEAIGWHEAFPLSLFILFFETGNLELSVWLQWLTREPPRFTCLCPAVTQLHTSVTTPGFYLNAGDLDSSPRTCRASTLHNEPSPCPCSSAVSFSVRKAFMNQINGHWLLEGKTSQPTRSLPCRVLCSHGALVVANHTIHIPSSSP